MKRFRKSIITGVFVIIAIVVVFWAKSQYVVPIIMYHKIDGNSATSRLSVSPESFKRQMSFLKNQHYNVVKLEELTGMIKENGAHPGSSPGFLGRNTERPLWPRMYKIPPKTIAITFDDGYESNYISAFPVLKQLGLHATIFIIPALVGTDGYATWSQIIEMSESGFITIGSHTMTHSWLPTQPVQRLDQEIRDSKIAIESHLDKEVASFSYPLGGFNKDVREKVAQAGYKIAVATNPGKKYPKHDIFAMKRLRISSTSDNLFVFWFEITGFYTWIKEHRDKD
ncbi:MAG: polysaccharide deacetylase family protein [Candidatus Omnitrophica bacterium]|nr:polysaccharide deacetylase family protein [Candidatus Omnitrophota bacterium]